MPAAAIQVKTLAYGPLEDQVLDLYSAVPLPDESMSTVVLAHGGLWQSGSRAELDTLCRNIVSQSNGAVACASIDYRLSHDLGGDCTGTGKDTYTDQARDLALAYSALQHNAESHGLDPRRMHVGGHSAGAHLAHILNLRWPEFAQPCNRADGCPAALSAIGLEGIYDIPAWNDYDASRWQSNFACATRRAFGAPGPAPAACVDAGLGERCWDAGSPTYLAENAADLGIKPAGDALLLHSPGDDWVDLADTVSFGGALEMAFPAIDVVTDTGGTCAGGQHNGVLREASLADCVINFVTGKVPPATTPVTLTPGMNDAWVNLDTLGQGFFFNVFPVLGKMFVAMFTYDIERPPDGTTATLGGPGQRWLTGLGNYDGNVAMVPIELTSGGIFNSGLPEPGQTPDYGTFIIEFNDCNSATVSYSVPSLDLNGVIPVRRATPDNIPLCEALNAP
jgi:pimeloyl-ACP methyl ester carboxylesterase